MAPKQLVVIGGFSRVSMLYVNQAPEPGASVEAEDHGELGGIAAIIAVAAYRSSHQRPDNDKGEVPANAPPEPRDGLEVRIIGAVADQENYDLFAENMRLNGVKTDRIAIKGGKQDSITSVTDQTTRTNTQYYVPNVINKWEPEDFNTIQKIGGSVGTPDLIIVTQELKKAIVEQIIDTAHEAGVDVIVYAAPAETLSMDHYAKITHLMVNEPGAGRMLGYPGEEVNMNTWPKICGEFFNQKGIKSIILKVGHRGVYFKNDQDEGFVSGCVELQQVVDENGAPSAFVGMLASEYLKHKDAGTWDMKDTATRGNKACAIVVTSLGYQTAMPWRNQVDDYQGKPLHDSIESLREYENAPRKRGKIRASAGTVSVGIKNN